MAGIVAGKRAGKALNGEQAEVSGFKKTLGKSMVIALAIILIGAFFIIALIMLLAAIFVPNAKGDFGGALAAAATISYFFTALLVNGVTIFALGAIDFALAAVKWKKNKLFSAALIAFGAMEIYQAITYKPEMPNLLELTVILLNLCTLIAIAKKGA